MRSLLLVTLVALAACSQPEALPVAVASPQPTAPASTAAAVVTGTTDTAEADALRAQVRDLQQQVNALQLAETDAKAETAKYEAGLGRCVDELNRVSGEASQRAALSYAPARPVERAAQPRVSTLGAPDVQILAGAVHVTGRVWNSGDGDADGRLYVELLRDGQVIDSDVVPLEVAARTDQAYSAEFHPILSNGTYSARVRFEL